MPVYDVRCTECGHRFDDYRSILDALVTPHCPRCSGETVNVIHAPQVHFKGPGFYENDSKGK